MSFTKMRRAIECATPSISVAANKFIDRLEEMLTKALAKGVPPDCLGKFYRSTMAKVTAPVMRYTSGDGRSSYANFDLAFLIETSDARAQLLEDIADARQSKRETATHNRLRSR